ncbi:hypothetical protein LJB99_05670 [Deltaproteobacteria bacterium OttesenSCG-928-K17]|nr:hypothetical protein [Deltaproteobacteria bacterium OttesenSCG-928-K17]
MTAVIGLLAGLAIIWVFQAQKRREADPDRRGPSAAALVLCALAGLVLGLALVMLLKR